MMGRCAACRREGARERPELGATLCSFCAAVAATAPLATCMTSGCKGRAERTGVYCPACLAAPIGDLPLFAEAP